MLSGNQCPGCRRPLDPRSRFCGQCGYDLATQTIRGGSPSATASGVGQGMGFAFGCLVAVMLIAVALVVMSRL